MRKRFTARSALACLAAALVAVAAIPVGVFCHYAWQFGMPIALFPLLACFAALNGALIHAFLGAYTYETRRLYHLLPLAAVFAGMMFGVTLVQMSAGMHLLAHTTGMVQWTGESLTRVGAIVSTGKAIASDVRQITSDAKGAVEDTKNTMGVAREAVASAQSLLDESRGLVEQMRKTWRLIELWWSAHSPTPMQLPTATSNAPTNKAIGPQAPSASGGGGNNTQSSASIAREPQDASWWSKAWSWTRDGARTVWHKVFG